VTASRFPRPYRDAKHLRGLATGDAGAVMVLPIRAGQIYFDAAKANSLPRNAPEGEHGSTVIDIGRGVQVRASGTAHLSDGAWRIEPRHFYANQYPSMRELTAQQAQRAREVIGAMIGAWADTHEGDIAQADDFDRHNAAHGLEEQIAKHQEALRILRKQLRACDAGKPFTQYPELPTGRR
jgi:hypothetical protein